MARRRPPPSLRDPTGAITGWPGAPRDVQRRRPPDFLLEVSHPITPRFLRGYIDLAISGTLRYERYEATIVGPWIDVPLDAHGAGMRGWIRQIGEMGPELQAKPLGTLLVVTVPGDLSWGESSPPPRWIPVSQVLRRPAEGYMLRVGLPRAVLHVTPVRSDAAQKMEEFGFDLTERFRRQLD